MNSHPQATARRGLSMVEALGCLVAVAGGVWIGASYVGLDLHDAAYTALDETELLTQIPEDWRPEDPDCPSGDCPAPEELRAIEQATLQLELDDLRLEVARLASATEFSDSGQMEGGKLSPEQQVVRDRTLAFWQHLTGIVTEVTAIQHRVTPFVGTEQHARALSVRRRALEYGQRATQLLNTEGVDPEAMATGARVSEWLGQAAETLQTAVDLRGFQAVDGRAVPAADVWAQTEAELRMRNELVRRKSAETATYLATLYFVEFPPLGL